MNDLTRARRELTATLGAVKGIEAAYGDFTERMTTPCVVVAPAAQWLADTSTFGPTFTVGLRVVLVAGPTRQAGAVEQLEALASLVILTALSGDWGLVSVAEPGVITVSTAEHLGTTITFQRELTLNKEH